MGFAVSHKNTQDWEEALLLLSPDGVSDLPRVTQWLGGKTQTETLIFWLKILSPLTAEGSEVKGEG